MKTLLALTLLLPFHSFAKDCVDARAEIDPVVQILFELEADSIKGRKTNCRELVIHNSFSILKEEAIYDLPRAKKEIHNYGMIMSDELSSFPEGLTYESFCAKNAQSFEQFGYSPMVLKSFLDENVFALKDEAVCEWLLKQPKNQNVKVTSK